MVAQCSRDMPKNWSLAAANYMYGVGSLLQPAHADLSAQLLSLAGRTGRDPGEWLLQQRRLRDAQ